VWVGGYFGVIVQLQDDEQRRMNAPLSI
jgi:hypothetical protein